jgi:hypothetical protein
MADLADHHGAHEPILLVGSVAPGGRGDLGHAIVCERAFQVQRDDVRRTQHGHPR